MIFDYISCFLGVLKAFLFKLLYFNRLKFKSIPKINGSTKIAIKKSSKLLLGKKFRSRNNVSIRIYNKGCVIIGNNCFFNDNCSISCQKQITIGNNVICGQNVMFFDNDHDYKNNLNGYLCDDIIIGNNVWIGANSIILKGTTIGNNSVIAAGSVVKGNIENNSLYYNKITSTTKKIKKDV